MLSITNDNLFGGIASYFVVQIELLYVEYERILYIADQTKTKA